MRPLTDDQPSRSEIALEVVETGVVPEQPSRLTRRKRQVIVDADTFGDHATVWFIRRGHGGEPVDETYDLIRENGRWRYHGGGGGEPGADLENRPTLDEVAAINETAWREPCPFGLESGGSFGKGRATLRAQVAVEVARLSFSDRPDRDVAEHGYFTVVYNPRKPPTISAYSADGDALGTYVSAMHKKKRMPRRFGMFGRRGSWSSLRAMRR